MWYAALWRGHTVRNRCFERKQKTQPQWGLQRTATPADVSLQPQETLSGPLPASHPETL